MGFKQYLKDVVTLKAAWRGLKKNDGRFQGWVAHGATELANIIVHGQPAPMYAHNVAPPNLAQPPPDIHSTGEPTETTPEASVYGQSEPAMHPDTHNLYQFLKTNPNLPTGAKYMAENVQRGQPVTPVSNEQMQTANAAAYRQMADKPEMPSPDNRVSIDVENVVASPSITPEHQGEQQQQQMGMEI